MLTARQYEQPGIKSDSSNVSMKCLVFDLESEYAHFRKPHTTTSPRTFPFPPRTAVTGIIGAILGVDRKDLHEVFDPTYTKTAIQILKHTELINVKINYRKGPPVISKKGLSTGELDKVSQVRLELLKKPEFRIFFSHANRKLYGQLAKHLSENTTVFPVYLGQSEHLAKITFHAEIELHDAVTSQNNWIAVHSIVRKDLVKTFRSTPGTVISIDKAPFSANGERVFTHRDYLYELGGKPVDVIPLGAVYGYQGDFTREKQVLMFLEQ
ncbi:MAG: type I-B CRISPR-associated protein Cas5b [Candidatus Odinarchaeota archaeon]